MRDRRLGAESACLVLVRHAVAEGDGRFQGQCDVSLTAQGRRQLRALVPKLSQYPVRVAYASDLLRAHATAAVAARKLGIKLEVRAGLREMDFGRWQGLSWKQIAKRWPRLARLWIERFPRQAIPGAELFDDFKKRVETELRSIVVANRGRWALVVTHAGVIRVALGSALGMPYQNVFRVALEPCAITVIEWFPNSAVVRCIHG